MLYLDLGNFLIGYVKLNIQTAEWRIMDYSL